MSLPVARSSGLKRTWSLLLDLGFCLLCLRFLLASGRTADWTCALLATTSFALACWRPAATLWVPVLGCSLLNGLNLTVLSVSYSPLLVIASSAWLGGLVRRSISGPSGVADHAGNQTWPPGTLMVDLLATIALAGVIAQAWPHRAAPDFWVRFTGQALHGPAAPFYFLTSAFLWLHGLFYFRALRDHAQEMTAGRIRLALVVNGAVLLFFFAVQWKFEFPFHWTSGYQSPYEDIATFGIMAACLLLISSTQLGRGRRTGQLLLGLGMIALALAVFASWSRGTWLATLVFLSVLALLRLPRLLAWLIPALLLGTVAILNVNATRLQALRQPHLDRLLSLVQVENWQAKGGGRTELYRKAMTMIYERPWTGHGIGIFFAKSASYAAPEDLFPGSHFPHNIVLQLAAEQGVPTALLFSGLMAWIFWRGLQYWLTCRRFAGLTNADAAPERATAALALGLTLALGAYLQANLTWDMLLVHSSQPHFFWFMAAAICALVERAPASPAATTRA